MSAEKLTCNSLFEKDIIVMKEKIDELKQAFRTAKTDKECDATEVRCDNKMIINQKV